ncbi:MAG: D-alanyl-D-alanine carboxypeptidase [Alphaproteobacteria bacterium]|nr:D-alanyl-D-alanine carboxypeptidase [Alphaproteobacteria bacterium]MBU1525288.1 D-alanyl-D-alanine carboxypeptidase [Alphaproteobacteria bacterium]MBU2116089.1 D-alanyl-D-alanine carboxypeptidase [Alphaproteobacteria bacterium]MBU2352589.1 D-alanyl-D-alanine carboxypeptidase [Alphaproteobacteria bacterium]MBU2382289.1 D-alanyl-D-alanine carboxypeptidase [Alphaproteobacteria bacterium]
MALIVRRALAAFSILLTLSLTAAPAATPVIAQENLRYAAIVIDAESGEVMFARHADARRYPASITKVMTLYLVFEALEQGKIKLDDVIRVSPHAAGQPPSKLGLAAGQTITVQDAIHATAIRSANDMAVALAEHVAGSEARFTAMMTLKAEDLGMTQTRYVNANGLPDSRQLTSARDLAMLCRALLRDFPQHYRYFGVNSWFYGGREYRNTNGLLSSGQGYDGIKTGFTNASGYNLAASAVRDGRRIITIVLGGRSTATRNEHVAELMSTGFEVAARRRGGERIEVAQTFFEGRGFGIGPDAGDGAVLYASLPGDSAAGSRAEPEDSDVRLVSAPAPHTDRTSELNRQSTPTTTSSTRRTAPPVPAGLWSVQVGAFRDETVARDWLDEVGRRFRGQFRGADRRVMNASGWFRSRFTGMTEDAARAACEALVARNVTCQVVRPD